MRVSLVLLTLLLSVGGCDAPDVNRNPSQGVIQTTDRLTDTLQDRRDRRQLEQDSIMESVLDEGG